MFEEFITKLERTIRLYELIEFIDRNEVIRVDDDWFRTKEQVLLYSDGTFGNYKTKYYYLPQERCVLYEYISMWQGERGQRAILSESQFFRAILKEEHDERVVQAIREYLNAIDEQEGQQ